MATYADQADFEDYVEGWTTTNPAALERLLKKAERDVDYAVGPLRRQANGLKFGAPKTTNERRLTASQVEGLTAATCAQAEYRHRMGPAHFSQAQHESVSGPDFSTQGKLPRVGPETMAELVGAGLLVTHAVALDGGGGSPFPVLPLDT